MKTTEHEDSTPRGYGGESGCADANATVHCGGAKNCFVRSIYLP